jgi:hypothetical protein
MDVGPGAQNSLGQPAEIPETPHVEQDVKEPDVDVVGSQDAPGLPAQSVGAKVSPEAQELSQGRVHGRDTAYDHRRKYEDIDSNDRDRHRRAVGSGTRGGHGRLGNGNRSRRSGKSLSTLRAQV